MRPSKDYSNIDRTDRDSGRSRDPRSVGAATSLKAQTLGNLETATVVLLDLDGTLADSIPALRETYFEFLAAYGARGSETEFARLSGPSLSEIARTLKQAHALEDSDESVYREYLHILLRKYEQEVSPMAGAELFLSTLKDVGLDIVLVSSAPVMLAERFFQRFGWLAYFKLLVGGDTVTRSKPHPEIYEHALTACGITSTQAIAIEDSANGVRAACRAAIPVLGLADEKLIESGATIVLPDLYAARDFFLGAYRRQ